MAVIVFDNKFNTKHIYNLICQVEEAVKESNDIDIYFSSDGGIVKNAYMLLDYFSKFTKKNTSNPNINIIIDGEISSSAFVFFISCCCSRAVLDNAVAKVHLCTQELSTRDMLDPNSVKSNYHKDTQRMNKEWLSFWSKIGFTKQELNRLKKGEFIFVGDKRLREMVELSQPYVYNYEKRSKNRKNQNP